MNNSKVKLIGVVLKEIDIKIMKKFYSFIYADGLNFEYKLFLNISAFNLIIIFCFLN